jgi:hypothetical protein
VSHGHHLHTEEHEHRIQTHDSCIRFDEGIWCLRPHGHCDRNPFVKVRKYSALQIRLVRLILSLDDSRNSLLYLSVSRQVSCRCAAADFRHLGLKR